MTESQSVGSGQCHRFNQSGLVAAISSVTIKGCGVPLDLQHVDRQTSYCMGGNS